MNTYEISREELKGLTVVSEGYRAVKWNSGTQQDFCYGNPGEELVGRIFKADGEISACEWGLHFCKDPAGVFRFYEPLGYNRYFKVRAYGRVTDSEDGEKNFEGA